MRCRLLAALLALSTLPGAAGAPREDRISVNILSKYRLTSFIVTVPAGTFFPGPAAVSLKQGKIVARREGARFVLETGGARYPLGGASLVTEDGFTISFEHRGAVMTHSYTGSLDIAERKGTLHLVCTLPLESYVAAAARDELGELLGGNAARPGAGVELLRAMEVVVRSYALRNRDRHKREGFQLCDLTHCIHFSGTAGRAASLTPGLILTDAAGEPLDAFFHSCCGGELAGPETWWPGSAAEPRYRRGPDRRGFSLRASCADSPHFTWHALVSSADMAAILETTAVNGLTAHRTGNRITALSWHDERGTQRRAPIARFMSRAGRRLGWNIIKSNLFEVRDASGGLAFSGHGLGHGVGLCQWGARGLAWRGFTWREMLDHYYPGAKIRPARTP